jgi:E3 ubiquitin-protein ligase ATL4
MMCAHFCASAAPAENVWSSSQEPAPLRTPVEAGAPWLIELDPSMEKARGGEEQRGKRSSPPIHLPLVSPKSVPRLSRAWTLAVLPKSSPDCIVGLSPFMPDAELRLLPACRRVFHAACIDAWLRTSPTCPLCPSCSRALPPPPSSLLNSRLREAKTVFAPRSACPSLLAASFLRPTVTKRSRGKHVR